MATCKNCKNTLILKDRKCIRCGAPLGEKQQATIEEQPKPNRFCPNCGKPQPLGAKFCYNCGEELMSTTKSPNRAIEAVDLGLPSGTKWASCNVGASKPEEFGGYYAWGEIKEKNVYGWDSYTHCDGDYSSCHNIGTNICGTEYDVARMKMGGRWMLPTDGQVSELIINCSLEWVILNGIHGVKFVGKNGNTIFLPAAGARYDYGFEDVNSYGCYWAGTSGSFCFGDGFGFDNNHSQSDYPLAYPANGTHRCVGMSVRAVLVF